MKMNGIDESLALGFFCRDFTAWQSFQHHILALHSLPNFNSLFVLDTSKPKPKSVHTEVSLLDTVNFSDTLHDEFYEGDDFELLEKAPASPKISLNSDGDDFDM